MEIVHGSIYGYRRWQLEIDIDSELPSLYPTGMLGIAPKWSCGITEAECIPIPHDPDTHSAPDEDCNCGLYATKKRQSLSTLLPQPVSGEVELFGRVIYHSMGYRAQYGRVYSIDKVCICHSCLEFHNWTRTLYLDETGTFAGFAPPRKLKYFTDVRRKSVRTQLMYVVLCESCKDEITSRQLTYQPHYQSSVQLDCIKPMKPIFDILTRLYCDGRLLTESE